MDAHLDSTQSGIAGEYLVAAELTRRGYIACLTLRNTRGIDILAASADGARSVGIQVKANQGREKEWVLSKKVESTVGENLFFVFVNLDDGAGRPCFHVVPSKVVSHFATEFHQEFLSRQRPDGRSNKDTPMRKYRDLESKYRDAWPTLGLDGAER